jgi:hypothetical protein
LKTWPYRAAIDLFSAGCPFFQESRMYRWKAKAFQEVPVLRHITACMFLSAATLSGLTKEAFSPWTPAHLGDVEARWHTDDLDPPACLVQVDRGAYAAEPIRIWVSYINGAGMPWRLSVILPAQLPGADADPAQRKIIGCVSVKQVEARQLTVEEAQNSRAKRPAAIISRR